MKYERLTNRKRFYEDEVIDMDEIYERLAKLEDKIEAGTLVFQEEKKKYYAIVGYRDYCGRFDYHIEYVPIEYEKENNQVAVFVNSCLYVTRKDWLFDTHDEVRAKLAELKGE